MRQGSNSGALALDVSSVSKTFGGTRALRDVNLRIAGGEIHGLAGANGSGKSSLIKILSGYHSPDPGGEVKIGGKKLRFGSPESSYGLGSRFVQQDLGLVDEASVADNLYVNGRYPTRFGTVRARALRQDTLATLAEVGLELDPRLPVGRLSPAMKTGLAVARALRHDPVSPAKLLVLDEPTASLPEKEVQALLEILRRAASRGVGILYVTHRLDELFALGCGVTVLRDGSQISCFAPSELTWTKVVHSITGKEYERPVPADGVSPARRAGRRVLSVEHLSAHRLTDVSFEVNAGEIVGVAGVSGSGREVLLSAIFGGTGLLSGSVRVGEVLVPPLRPDLSVGEGVAYLPADRKASGGMLSLSARDNLCLPRLRPFWRHGWFQDAAEQAETERWFDELTVRPWRATERPLALFSGGNQQKILLAKWLRCQPRLLLLDEPTQGVDIGVRAEVHRRLLDSAREGAALLVGSTDLEELEILCDRVLILRDGCIGSEMVGTEVTEVNISRRCLEANQKEGV